MGIESQAKSGWKAVKDNWMFFVIAALAIGVLTLWWDHKKGGTITAKLATWPIVGKLFTATAALVLLVNSGSAGQAFHVVRRLAGLS